MGLLQYKRWEGFNLLCVIVDTLNSVVTFFNQSQGFMHGLCKMRVPAFNPLVHFKAASFSLHTISSLL